MKRRISVCVALGVAAAALAFAAVAGAGGAPLSTTLTGAAEVPGPGDPDGSGTASLTLNPGQEEICYELTVSNIAPATAAHIHEAPAGVAGSVVVGLVPPTSGSSSACATADRELVLDILQNPSDYYVNVHNAPYPAGAVRGQLSRP
ncbi:MAG: CHRD domain-containing protein [Actinomycetota bacterium]|nr:CHRD domain-containing protein [Actinomycetota bacterium]